MELDGLDEKILAYLDNNARTQSTKIAKKLMVNKNVVNYRIKNMEESGLITGYHTLINSYRLGYQAYRLYLRFQYTDPKKEQEIEEYFIRQKNTWLIGRLKGSWHLFVLFWVKEQKEIVALVNDFIKQHRQYIDDYRLVIYYCIGHYRYPFTKKYLKEKSNFNYLTLADEIPIDETDKKLLDFLSTNARAPLLQIAKKLNLSHGAVRYRMKNLIKNGIIAGFRPTFDAKKLGYLLYKLDINVKDGTVIDKIYSFAREHNDIFYINNTLGYADVEIETQVTDSKQFFTILRELTEKFSGQIRNYSFFVVEEFIKTKYMPAT